MPAERSAQSGGERGGQGIARIPREISGLLRRAGFYGSIFRFIVILAAQMA
jgi:hypothetical protein